MRDNNYMTQSKELRRALICNAALCSVALISTMAAWVTILLLGVNCTDISEDIDIGSQSLVWAVEQFVVCNCVLLTMTDWPKFLLWPCVVLCKIDPSLGRFKYWKPTQSYREKLLIPSDDEGVLIQNVIIQEKKDPVESRCSSNVLRLLDSHSSANFLRESSKEL